MSMLHISGGATEDKLYVDDVFSTYLYTGNDSTQTINNGIDLAGKGGLVWSKSRTSSQSHFLISSDQSLGWLISNSTNALTPVSVVPPGVISSFNSNGYTLGIRSGVNLPGESNASWTFRKAPKFFDVVTYTGNGSSQSIAHSLSSAPGMVIVKAYTVDNSSEDLWYVYHIGASGTLRLNTTAAQDPYKYHIGSAGATTFHVTQLANKIGLQYVAYLFAHDTDADGIIQCGSYTGNGSATGPVVSLGWEPQYLMIKNASGTGNWQIIDNMRGMPVGSADAALQANSQNAETSVDYVSPTATGFQITSTSSEVNTSSSSYIYMAIRRPMKVPTSGTEVYNAWAFKGTGGFQNMYAGFPPDTVITYGRSIGTAHCFVDRNRGSRIILRADSGGGTQPESLADAAPAFTGGFYGNKSIGTDNIATAGINWFGENGNRYVYHFFRRAPGFFDVVCYTGDGSSKRLVPHGLGTKPQLVIYKARNTASDWVVHCFAGSYNAYFYSGSGLNSSAAAGFKGSGSYNGNTTSTFVAGEGMLSFGVNITSNTYVAYLFASLPGISKVGSYTGNGSSQIVPCGFTTGARFILIKRTDSTGDWYIWDTARGIVAANDPHLSLNSTEAEVTTDDSIDPEASGFIVNQNTATNINVLDGTYIFLAIA